MRDTTGHPSWDRTDGPLPDKGVGQRLRTAVPLRPFEIFDLRCHAPCRWERTTADLRGPLSLPSPV